MSRIHEALQHLSPHDRDTWVRMGMAIKSEEGDPGYEIWDAWSRLADSYNQKDAKAVWRSIKPGGGITIGTLYHAARDAGWKDDGEEHQESQQEREARRRRIIQQEADAARKVQQDRENAARKAREILGECVQTQHAYLDLKNFGEMRWTVYRPDTDNLLIVPMYVGKRLVGCQMIDIEGGKKFIHGQQAKGAEFCIGRGDLHCWCEGFATGLSIHAAEKQRLTIHICFSAGNLTHMAKSGFIIADNDASCTGQKAAEATGLPYLMPPKVGQDFNDLHREIGLFQTTMFLKNWLLSNRKML